MIYPLDKRNTKKLKTKPADSLINTSISVKFFSKKAKITKSLFMKNSKNNNIILGFSIWFQLIQWIDQKLLNSKMVQIITVNNTTCFFPSPRQLH